jgi:Tfp pilus assembly protein PilF
MARELLGRIDALAAPAPLDDELPSMFTSDRIEEVLREKHKYAREYLNDVLRQEPGNRPARRGLDALTSPQGTGAVDVRARYAEATSKAAQGDPAGAKTILREIVGRDPSFAPAHNDLAVLSVNDGETAQARMHYERAVALAPESVVFRKNLGDFYFAVSGDPESALEQYIKVLGQKPNEVETLLSIAQVCESLRRFEDASAFYTTVAQLEPGNRLAQEGLTRVNAPHTETAMSHGRTN